ncbi:DUF6992 family protein [Pararhodonellum marinum]|uniref:DUF6992 family protein n=1 Tax=Pararhodonellum marinum TaxID=2755358 RepID=UPI0018900176|nr:hypothetical protein [Pararhodonellum marinum]
MKILHQLLFIFGFALLMTLPQAVQAQNGEEWIPFNQKRLDYNRKGMLILGSWAVGNMILGGALAGKTYGEVKAFHQMNLYWNSVNLLIAGFGYYGATREIPSQDFWETIQAQQSIEKILLVNAALDVAYMAGGFWLQERGKRLDKPQFIGFGKSVVLQGAFLMSFDVILYLFHRNHAVELPKILESIRITENGLGLLLTF